MNYLRERVAYLKGLAEGMQLDDSTNEGKMLKAIIEVLDDFALTVDDIEEVQEQMEEQIDNIDEDLAEIERVVFDEDFAESEDNGYIGEYECPYCSEEINVFEDMFDDETRTIVCPHCYKDVEIEWECECEDCTGEDEEEE